MFLLVLSAVSAFAQAPVDEFPSSPSLTRSSIPNRIRRSSSARRNGFADHLKDQNIKLVIGLGDIVDGGEARLNGRPPITRTV